MKEELNKPLGLKTARKLSTWQLRLAGGAVIAVAVVAVGAAAWWLAPGARGPTAVAVIATPAVPTIAPDRTGSTVAAPTANGLSEMQAPTDTLTEIGKVTISDPSSNSSPLQLAALPDKNLVEATDKGPLPRVGADGTRPLDAYARPSDRNPGDIRVAIVVGGLGLDPDGTRQAIATLPGAITLAFAPYGNDLATETAAARAAGHELLLQIPLEPFNYPTTDPGPNTLTTDATAAVNDGRLRWFLGRMTNYIGVTNYMGARFTGEEAALAPVMQEIGDRGLLYLDDGSSARSTAADIAGSRLPFLRADVVLDADLSPAAIDDSLSQLQAIARQRGYAIATATAFPATIDRVTAFANAAAGKGITLVPLSALTPPRS